MIDVLRFPLRAGTGLQVSHQARVRRLHARNGLRGLAAWLQPLIGDRQSIGTAERVRSIDLCSVET